MNSSDYIEVEVSIDPFSEENAEILEAMLSDLPYDSFEIGEGSVKCYIQQPLFDRRALRVVLDGLPFAAEFAGGGSAPKVDRIMEYEEMYLNKERKI